jgi:hypothetical protein
MKRTHDMNGMKLWNQCATRVAIGDDDDDAALIP